MITSRHSWRPLLLSAALAVCAAAPLQAQGKLTTPKEFFGHNIGDDYWLPTYDQFMGFWKKLDAESNRMQVFEIGKTGEGRPHLAAIVTAPENFAKLARYKEISQRLHAARGIDSTMARQLAKEGKSVMWIDGGLHATEVLGANQLLETSWQMVSGNDEETLRILKDVIIVFVHANPDGMQMVAKCYMAQNPGTGPGQNPQANACSPRLYERYAGHDNNRDFYMSNLPESQNMNKLMYWEWLPQVMYNHHQTGPAGTVMFSPPFRDPFNYNVDPMIVMGLDMVGAAMHQRFLQEGKPGFTMRSGSSYSTWWNGGLRTTGYFQNIIGILTETIGSPTPSAIPVITNQILPRGDLPAPIEPTAPGGWHFRQSIDYSVTANRSILDLMARYKDQMLYNIWKMGSNQIERGSRDHWTISNEDMARADSAVRGGAAAAGRGGRGGADAPAGDVPGAGGGGGGRGGRGGGMSLDQYKAIFKNPARRDPRAFVITSAQPDFATATKFINAIRYIGVEVNQTTAPLTVNGKTYPTGSYVVNAAQAGRAHVMDMFMPQDHPNDMDERGIPRRPYDNAGWTLALQMGVQFDSLYTTVTGPMTMIQGLAKPVAGKVTGGSAGYLLSPSQNDAFTVANRVLKANGEVYRTKTVMTANGNTYGPGSFFIVATPATTSIIQTAATELGIDADGVNSRPTSLTDKYTTRRIALVDSPTGSMPSGWTRLIFERFEFPFTIVCGAGLDDANLRSKYDVIVVPSGSQVGGVGGGGRGGGGGGRGGAGANVAAANDPDLRSLCEVTTGTGTGATAAENIRKFVEQGGLLVAAGSASRGVGSLFNLPMTNHLIDREPGEQDTNLGSDKFYVPGSVLRVAVDTTTTAAYGSASHIDVFFDNSPVFRLAPDATMRGIRPVMWFDSRTPLRSGWAWGQNYLDGGVAAVEANVGRGRLYLYGPEITFRAQPHGTFKFLFNGIYGGQ